MRKSRNYLILLSKLPLSFRLMGGHYEGMISFLAERPKALAHHFAGFYLNCQMFPDYLFIFKQFSGCGSSVDLSLALH